MIEATWKDIHSLTCLCRYFTFYTHLHPFEPPGSQTGIFICKQYKLASAPPPPALFFLSWKSRPSFCDLSDFTGRVFLHNTRVLSVFSGRMVKHSFPRESSITTLAGFNRTTITSYNRGYSCRGKKLT